LTTDNPAPAAHGAARFPLAALVAAPSALAILTINFWIYYARVEFAALHPDYVAEQPPTISRGISDPSIGEPFAVWVSISSLFILLGVVQIATLYLRSASVLPAASARTGRALRRLARAMVAAQCVATVGIVMLSVYRFPTHDLEHMVGSYIFFIAQAAAALLAGAACTLIARDAAAAEVLAAHPYINPRISRWRGPFALGSALMALAFLTFFILKDVDLGAWNGVVYQFYVLSEPALITYFLTVQALYLFEIARMARAGRGR
jgi:hypothetical protein